MSGGGFGWLVPPKLSPGATIRVIAPSGPLETRLVWRGLGWLSERYDVRFDRGIFEATGYLAGNDARRREELAKALIEPGVAAVICARGGYGASRFVHELDWSSLRLWPRWLVGFSDVTALHVEATGLRVASLHGPNVTALGRGDSRARASFVEAIENPDRHRSFAGLEALVLGSASGRLCGGNLTLLHACAAAGRLRLPDSTVLFLEDVGERPYRLDRMLTTLRTGGHLAQVAAFAFGEFTDCGPGMDGVSVLDVARAVLGPLGKPIAAGVPSGHGVVNEPLLLGSMATLVCEPGGATLDLSPP